MIGLRITVPAAVLELDKPALRKALRAVGRMVAKAARGLIRGTKASKPGEPPANRTGNLARNLQVRMGRGGQSVRIISKAQDGSEAYYGRFLETGAVGGGGKAKTRNKRTKRGGLYNISSKRVLKPRPFLSAALEQQQGAIDARLAEALGRGVRLDLDK